VLVVVTEEVVVTVDVLLVEVVAELVELEVTAVVLLVDVVVPELDTTMSCSTLATRPSASVIVSRTYFVPASENAYSSSAPLPSGQRIDSGGVGEPSSDH